MAYIYENEESMKVEPEYIHKRHEALRAAKDEPAAEEEPAAQEEALADEGGDE